MMRGGFASLHPSVSFAYYAGVLLLCMLLLHPVLLAVASVLLAVLLALLGGWRRLARQLPGMLAVPLAVTLMNPLFSHRGRHILFYLFDQPITLEAILYGATMGLSLLAILLAFASYQQVVTTDRFLYLFGAAAPRLALLTLMTVRFVPLFRRRLHEITAVQKQKGISVSEGVLRKRMKDGMLLLRVLLTWSLEEALQTADSMKARGYGSSRRSSYTIYRMDGRDRLILTLLAGLAAATGICRAMGLGVLTVYPRLEPITLSVADGACLGAFTCFLIIPIILEGGDKLAWQFSPPTM
ncbi:ABC transporter permease [Paenibacillus sp. J31TS4]|uniref:energy-coupling factor transporter transmembrane component T n=1 Tax=Paenibacillus sp. J31TS4 TaxID=2807195 RepID=UPI001B212B68|nr:energy-coupling factor transporter transmembrane component T [Paenibacillus sp. J31TS4]GIP39395.1 ABC transporter permease [Paenibacillus sp. J31TS4]